MDPASQRDFTCTEAGIWRNNRTGQVLPHCSPVCGRPSNPVTFRERVLRGSEAKRGNFPWLVRFGGVQGAGALLSERWVLTAAHVVHNLRERSLFAGFTDLRRLDLAQRLLADRIFIHPGYQQPLHDGVHNYDNDIALVRLRTPVTLGPDISPVCLPERAQSGPKLREMGLVAGWGVTENNTLPAELMYTRLLVLDLDRCRQTVAQNPVTVTDNMICAGDDVAGGGSGGGSDTCQGDSGGAFVFPLPKPRNDRFYVGGIVSWGVKCGTCSGDLNRPSAEVLTQLSMKEPPLLPAFSASNVAGDPRYSDIMEVRTFLVLIALSPPVSGSDDPGLFGEIRLPNYHPDERLSWEVAVSPGFGLRLRLQHYDSERSSPCRHNYVEVYADRERLGRFCGNTTSSRFHQPSPSASGTDRHTVRLRVRSHSASRESRRGFFISYEAVDVDECGVRWEGQAPCQHFCHNYIGGYRCYCRRGYSLHSDGKTCQVTQCGVPEDIENGSYEYLDGEAGTRAGSVVSYRCRQTYYTMVGGADGKYSCRDNGKWMNSVVGETLPSCKPVCGKPQRPPLLIQRIFGGAPARDGNFPWQVYFENRVCGGALLSDAWVLSSASCVQGELRPRMFAGATDRSSAAGWTALEGVEVHVHPGYAKSPVGHNIALVRLREKVRMGPTMSPICLPRDEVEVGTVGLVSGFGETEHFSQSEVLMFAPVPVVERNNCQEASAPLPLTPTVICAGTGGGADACTGDGGGALVFKDPLHYDIYFTAGVVSWGQKCGEYGVYTSVRNHLEWIESIMGP
ncbi:complement C1s subcomponent-like [Hypanus sabinus]|uniref:complement C1s subcomponent-like n=1 Tax=Hypanus sabinus TaxID=79690 RepID=UPI0028C3E71B|nr:complement C1s subcomponent-like [Hypanus sabinus]